MYHKIRHSAINIIEASPFEEIVRQFYAAAVPSKGNLYDRQTVRLMKKVLRPHSNCIDVGAYRGEILQNIIDIAPQGKHFAFEPTPANYQHLKNKHKAVSVHNIAVSDKEGDTTFHHVVGRAARSGLHKVEYPDKNQEVQAIKVRMSTLDKTIPKNTPIDLIKIDVEGAEHHVLQGARRLIKKNNPVIIFEHEMEKAKHFGTRPAHIYSLLHDLGLKVSLISRYLEGGSPLSPKEFIRLVDRREEFYFVAYK